MANEELIVKDPLGNDVILRQILCEKHLSVVEGDIYDDFVTVIQKPALLIELTDQPIPELCYYRSIGWHITLMIMVRKTGDGWEAYHCLDNPTPQFISELLARGRQII